MSARFVLHEPDGTLREQSDVRFDEELGRLWDDRDATGVVEYGIEGLERRRVGALGIQLNRGRQRKEEHLARKLRDDNPVLSAFGDIDGTDFHAILRDKPRQRLMDVHTGGRHLAIQVNYAPILPHHFLLVPAPDEDAPQLVTPRALADARALFALSDDPTLILGYNSLGAWASINHLHFQGVYYPTGRMNVMRAPRSEVASAGGVRIERVRDFPFPSIAVTGENGAELGAALAATDHLGARNVPYTLLLTRREVFIVPKARGRGDLIPTGAGFYETGGEVFVGDRALYERLTEAEVYAELALGAVSEAMIDELVGVTVSVLG